jgi:hypothetical protein
VDSLCVFQGNDGWTGAIGDETGKYAICSPSDSARKGEDVTPNIVPFRIPTGAELARMSPEARDRVLQRMKVRGLSIEERYRYCDSVADFLRLHSKNPVTLTDEAKPKSHDLFDK